MLTRADIYRTQGHLVIESDLPGVDEDDVRLWVSRDRLRIDFRRRSPDEASRVSTFRRERIPGDFSRDLRLPLFVDPESLEAKMDHGTLRVRMRLDEDAAGEREFGVVRLEAAGDTTRLQ